MPIIDHERNVLVVRVVYDGPPLSGKTTTLKTLARGLGVDLVTPEERDGRTIFFDWVDYVGGLFEGRQIRCQIVSVPGQRSLKRRRAQLLDTADAVVMVADTRTTKVTSTIDLLRDLLVRCRAKDPPVGFVLQANKRDAPDRMPREELQAELAAIAPVAIVETIATTGEGVREAFVFGVRLALDRVRALAGTGRLAEGKPSVDGPSQLLAELKSIAEEHVDTTVDDVDTADAKPDSQPPRPLAQLDELVALQTRQTSEPPALASAEQLFVPDPMMPGGFIWPPVDGRSLLYEVAKVGLSPRYTDVGDWWASEGGWHCHSVSSSLFEDTDRGRRALIEWARLHAMNVRKLSAGRALILADAGRGKVRLWQLVRDEPTLRARVLAKAHKADAQVLASELNAVALLLLRAREVLHSKALRLTCALSTLGTNVAGQPIYAGLMPQVANDVAPELDGAELIEREMTPLIRLFAFERDDFAQVADALGRWPQREPGLAAQTLARIGARSDWS
jgi:signal recognition particle receptor subunit beta